jgi:hypothetical protein
MFHGFSVTQNKTAEAERTNRVTLLIDLLALILGCAFKTRKNFIVHACPQPLSLPMLHMVPTPEFQPEFSFQSFRCKAWTNRGPLVPIL